MHSATPADRFGPDVKWNTIVFFHKLVLEQWERIEWLSPFIISQDFINGVEAAMQRKAPYLRSFALPIFYYPDDSSTGTMFSNDAPRLRSFRATNGKCNFDPVWMSNLNTLCLGGEITSKEVCSIIVHLPNLKSLELERHKVIKGFRIPKIYLPKLRTLILDECLYLRRITKPPGCSLVLRGWDQKPIDLFDECRDRIADTIIHSLSLSPTRFMALDFQSHFKLRMWDRQFPYRNPEAEFFDIQLFRRGPIYLQETIFPGLLYRLTSIFSTVNTLLIRFNEGSSSAAFESKHTLKRFITFFSSVEKLYISEKDLGILLEDTVELDESPYLPSLQTLALFGEWDPSKATYTRRFLRWRQTKDAQISTLDLSRCTILDTACHLCMLDKFAGIKLVWTKDGGKSEYKCGSWHASCTVPVSLREQLQEVWMLGNTMFKYFSANDSIS
ncbi:hypothetical protein JR316_0011863 [Psilocybe cubensis]|uniref:Uncharacterized protein n=2 Tax=Psilocybe cubensis TaxID=181762 RepID=A0A8H7XNS8_PSICU|nr:hypothetical protein JR316_0011863 [Psilocybe cubensis]KAH9476289.1 hypothetical protein JR316_0011863 [Psilocybe cubensis]